MHLIGALTLFVSVVIAIAVVASADGRSTGVSSTVLGLACFGAIGGLCLYFAGRFLTWWHHG